MVPQVGFRGVEEKKSLDLLLGEKPVDLARVQNFCLRFPLPSIYRIQVILKPFFSPLLEMDNKCILNMFQIA